MLSAVAECENRAIQGCQSIKVQAGTAEGKAT